MKNLGESVSTSMLNVISQKTKCKNNNNQKQTQIKRQKIRHNQYSQSNKIFNYMVNTSNPEAPDQEETSYGSTHTIKPKDCIRLWFTNPCGLGVDPFSHKSDDSLHFLRHKSKCDIFGLAETNLHWKMLHNSATLYSRLRQKWKYFKQITSHNSHANLGKTQRGGTCMATVGQAAYRHHSQGTDQTGLGRWSWMEFRGKNDHATRVYTAYRPGGKPSSDSERTTVYHQQKRYLQKRKLNIEPRNFFDESIIEEIRSQIEEKNVILMLDANQNVQNGPFTESMSELGLVNVISTLNDGDLPATHHRGSKPISAIYATSSLDATRSGILPKGSGVHGDHRNMFVDITSDSFFGTYMFMIVSPPMKRLQLHDSRIVARFKKYTLAHLRSNGLIDTADNLLNNATHPPTREFIEQMEKFDDQIGRAITLGKKKARKLCTGNIPYSNIFANLRDTRRIWLLVRKRKLGQKISCKTIRRLAKKLLIVDPFSPPLQEVNHLLKKAEVQYKSLTRQQAREGRARFNEELAAANAAASNEDKVKVLQRIINMEQQREQTIVTRKYFPKKGGASKQVDRVQYQQNGTWKEAYRPQMVSQACQNDTKSKYSETNSTPLMREPLHSLFGNFCETKFARAYQKGTKNIPIPVTTYTSDMLEYTKLDESIPRIPIKITAAEIKQTWKVVKEHKSSAPSGRYNGVYKAMTQDPELLRILEVSMNLPLLTGYSYRRWNTMVDIMAFKKPDNIKVSNIRSIIISEADWNTIGKLVIAKKMMKNAENSHLMPREHIGGRKGRKATDGALTKRLAMDNSRLLRKPLAIISTDAANCYDRMLHKFISLICIKWGIAPQVIKTLLYPLQNARHHTRTAFGDSSTYFQGRNLQGAGQGNTGAAPYWTAVSTVMIDMMRKRGLLAAFSSPLNDEEILLALLAFVDDTELFITDDEDNIENLKTKVQIALNTWKELLHVTGGVMRSTKCAWTLLNFSKTSHTPLPMHTDPGDIYLQDEDGQSRTIHRYDRDFPREYLGIHQAATGKDDAQVQEMFKAVEKWNSIINASKLPPALNLKALMSKIHRKLMYPLPALTVGKEVLESISNKLYWVSLPKCGIVRTFPIKYRHLPYKYQGLQLPDLYIEQEASKLRELISFSYKDSVVWDQLRLGLESLQHMLGLSDIVYNFPYQQFYHLCDHSWIMSQWKFISSQKGMKIQGWRGTRKTLRVHDSFLMETFATHPNVDPNDLKKLNNCRTYLQAWTLSDIVDGSGTKITSKAFSGRLDGSRISTSKWKKVRRPVETHWEVWRKYLNLIYCTGSSARTLTQPLTHWINEPSQTWLWYFDRSTTNLYRSLPGHHRCYTMTSTNARLGTTSFQLNSIVDPATIDITNMDRATICNENITRYSTVRSDGWYSVIQPPSPHTFPDLPHILGKIQVDPWMYAQGNLHLYDTTALQSILSKPLRMVSDGSYKDQLGAACIIIEPFDQSAQLIIVCPVPSNSNGLSTDNDPYRCELTGIYVGFAFIQQFELYFKSKMEITVACDSDSALLVPSTYSFINATNPHFDVARSLITIRDDIRSSIKYEYVQGHADKLKPDHELTRTELLNKSCDLIAKAYRESMTTATPVSLKEEGLSLWMHNKKIYNAFLPFLKDKYYDEQAKQVLSLKYQWEDNQFDTVDWEAISKATKIMASSTLIRISKMVTHTLPVGKTMETRQTWRESYCPRCEAPLETCLHICQCPHTESRTIMGKSIQRLSNWLESVNTESKLHMEIISNISLWVSSAKLPTSSQTLPIHSQLTLGWHHLMEGRLHRSFSAYMESHFQQINSKMKGTTWSAIFIQKIWTYIFEDQWQIRNKVVHSRDDKTKSTREHQNLNFDIRKWHNDESSDRLLCRDRHLFSCSLTHILRKSTAVKRAWLEDIAIATEARNDAKLRDEVYSANVMHRFLATTNRRVKHRKNIHRCRSLIRRKKIKIAHARTRQMIQKLPGPASRLFRPKRKQLEIHASRKKKKKKKKKKRKAWNKVTHP